MSSVPTESDHEDEDTTAAHKISSSPSSYSLTAVAVVAFSLAALLRISVGYQPHSGQDNWHGLWSAYGGDFEAQRHWTEVCWNLPLGDWYWYHHLQALENAQPPYWPLDYPPLSAYLSWLCGGLSHVLVGPETVAWETSRGIEDPVHKAFMRATVLVTDLCIYGSFVWHVVVRTTSGRQRKPQEEGQQMLSMFFRFVLVMAQPAILLIDHGHFQYNTTALGLALWSFWYMTRGNIFGSDQLTGSILFCCALSFKQMTLYYGPAVFFYLLGRCCRPSNVNYEARTSAPSRRVEIAIFLRRFLALSVTVIVTFCLIWGPVLVHGPDDTTPFQRLFHILRRILPLNRGLLEGKVSNLWCALSVKPFRIRQRIPVSIQPLAALGLTLMMIAPSSWLLFEVGRRRPDRQGVNADFTLLLWGTTGTALAFFLASFQVHEKSLLLALAPASLLTLTDFADSAADPFVDWFSMVTVWTLWPLLVIDRLQTAYVCTIVIYRTLLRLESILLPPLKQETMKGARTSELSTTPSRHHRLVRALPSISVSAMLMLHVAELLIPAPPSLPDLCLVLWTVVGCGFCCLAWMFSCWHLYEQVMDYDRSDYEERSAAKSKTL